MNWLKLLEDFGCIVGIFAIIIVGISIMLKLPAKWVIPIGYTIICIGTILAFLNQ